MENKKEQIIAQLQDLLNSDNPTEAYAKAKQISKGWKKVRDEEESFYDQEMSKKLNALMDELSEKAGVVFVNAEEAKNNIIEKAKKVIENNNFKKGTDEMKALLDEWKRSGRSESKEKDDELWAQFNALRDEFFTKKNEYYDNLKETFKANKAAKEALIEKAKAILDLDNMKEAGEKANEVMDEWKKLGSAGHKTDNELWDKFLEQRKAYYVKRDAYYDSMKETYNKRAEEKKAIIAEAKIYLARGEFTEEEIAAVKELRNKWKQVGNSGKNNEESLWEEFNTIINKYFENMRFYKQN